MNEVISSLRGFARIMSEVNALPEVGMSCRGYDRSVSLLCQVSLTASRSVKSALLLPNDINFTAWTVLLYVTHKLRQPKGIKDQFQTHFDFLFPNHFTTTILHTEHPQTTSNNQSYTQTISQRSIDTSTMSSTGNTNPGNFANRPKEEVSEIAKKGGESSHQGGFASMDPDKQVTCLLSFAVSVSNSSLQKEIASMGGQASSGSFEKGSEAAKEAGKKGGLSS